jgi:hypothetical protein
MENEQKTIESKNSWLKRYWWIGLLALAIVAGAILAKPIFKCKDSSKENKKVEDLAALEAKKQEENADPNKIIAPACPSDVSNILTSPIVEPKYIKAIRPNGAINPPGHTSPVDHATFMTDYAEKIPIYAPADGWIYRVIKISWLENGQYVPSGYRIYEKICDGLEISAGGYKEFEFDSELKEKNGECQSGIDKGSEGTSANCDYKFNKKVRAGDLIGYTKMDPNGTIPFEWWANNYNQTPRLDVNWAYYNDGSQYATCLFDLYAEPLKSEYYPLFGHYDKQGGFTPRTVKPYCGEINQNKVGTIQGMWFGGPPDPRQEMAGKGIAFIHEEFDPTKVVLSIGGNIAGGQRNIAWISPKTEGQIDRDPGDIPADGKVYCYDLINAIRTSNWKDKVLVQLIDSTHMKVEKKSGVCTSSETFSTPFSFER